jgi:hypothetical protein
VLDPLSGAANDNLSSCHPTPLLAPTIPAAGGHTPLVELCHRAEDLPYQFGGGTVIEERGGLSAAISVMQRFAMRASSWVSEVEYRPL